MLRHSQEGVDVGMVTVRSQRLLGYIAAQANVNSPVWATPAGYTTLVKSVIASNNTGTASDVTVIAGIQSGGTEWVYRRNVPAFSVLEQECWFVLNPGDFLYAVIAVVGVAVWISGSVLTGAPTLPPAALSLERAQLLAALLASETKPVAELVVPSS